jgi:N-acetylneuraminate synthase/sialic acid synthase
MDRKLVIDSVCINDTTDCYVVAEIGHNHQGSVEKAKALVLAAKDCGANAVKLQKRHNHTLYTRSQYEQIYDNENSFGLTYGEHREALEFDKDEYIELLGYARDIGITLFATAFDIRSADFLHELDMPAFKIASGDIKNTPLLRYVAGFGKPMLVSTGAATIEDVQRAYDVIMPINRQLCLLQCTASYPVTPEDMNLRVIETYRERFPDIVIGLSDHQSGIAMGPVAYLLGASIIEKHFTLNRAMKGTDHAFSLEPAGMRKLVRDLHRTRWALGSPGKCMLECEKHAALKMGKKLVAVRYLQPGHVLAAKDIAIKSPGDGLPPYELENVIGRRVRHPVPQDGTIAYDLLSEDRDQRDSFDDKTGEEIFTSHEQ